MNEISHIHLDAIGGIAGDMFVAAIIDAWPEWSAELVETMGHCHLPAGWAPSLARGTRHGIAGQLFSVVRPAESSLTEAQSDRHHRHDSGDFSEIRQRIVECALSDDVKAGAIAIFELLAEAESGVHGVPVDRVHFHELADWDSVCDIIAAAWLIDRIGACTWSVSALPLGSGMIQSAHGALPIPSPAATRLMAGFEVIDDGISGERVTPTGAAILQHLRPVLRKNLSGRISRVGHGLGSREIPGKANLLRLMSLTPVGDSHQTSAHQVATITFEIDDQTSEDLAVGLDHLRGMPAVLDVCVTPVIGKKGRLMQRVQVLSDPEGLESVCNQCFLETTTIGLRWRLENRVVLNRSQIPGGPLMTKLVTRPDGVRTAKAEISDVADLGSHAQRDRRRAQAEQRAVGDESE